MRNIAAIFGGILGVGLLVAAFWGWQRDEAIAAYVGGRNLAVLAWAVRCAAIAVLAVGEGVLVLLVVARVWRRDVFTTAVALSAALVFMLSGASAVALGLAGR
jgi:hypothetical protein